MERLSGKSNLTELAVCEMIKVLKLGRMVGDGVMLVDLASSTTIDKMLTNQALKADLDMCPNFCRMGHAVGQALPPEDLSQSFLPDCFAKGHKVRRDQKQRFLYSCERM